MRLDLELVRQIMLELEDKGGNKYVGGEVTGAATMLRIPGRPDDALVFHCIAMIDGEFIAGEAITSDTVYIDRITWKGHEFIALSRNATWFEWAKKQAVDRGLPAMWMVLIEVLKRKIGSAEAGPSEWSDWLAE